MSTQIILFKRINTYLTPKRKTTLSYLHTSHRFFVYLFVFFVSYNCVQCETIKQTNRPGNVRNLIRKLFGVVSLCRRRKTTVKMLCIYADYKSDESYTPSKISVRVGNNFHNLLEIRVRIHVQNLQLFITSILFIYPLIFCLLGGKKKKNR